MLLKLLLLRQRRPLSLPAVLPGLMRKRWRPRRMPCLPAGWCRLQGGEGAGEGGGGDAVKHGRRFRQVGAARVLWRMDGAEGCKSAGSAGWRPVHGGVPAGSLHTASPGCVLSTGKHPRWV